MYFLYHRVAADYGRGTANKLRPVKGFYDMYLGKDLADNEWHTVEFIRHVRESTLYIDRGRGKMEKSAFRMSPPTYSDLSISMVAFGGYYSFVTSEISTKKALSRKGINACFTEATFSQTYPEDDSKEIDFLKNDDNILSFGTISNDCTENSPRYAPLYFSSSAVHIALVENYTIDSMKVALKFRTVISDQVLANYSTIKTGEMVELRIDRKGHVTLRVDVGFDSQVIQTSKPGYHDGEWHDVSFDIDNKESEGQNYQWKFQVDGKTRYSALAKKFNFDGYVNIGFGFAGCMRDILINDNDIMKVVRDPKVSNEYFTVSDIGVIHNSCSLKDYCNPNPCKNGGKCNQTDDNIVCDCRNTLYEGSTCHRGKNKFMNCFMYITLSRV